MINIEKIKELIW